MHRIGGSPNNCKCLWIQVGTEPAGVQLLFLSSCAGRGPGCGIGSLLTWWPTKEPLSDAGLDRRRGTSEGGHRPQKGRGENKALERYRVGLTIKVRLLADGGWSAASVPHQRRRVRRLYGSPASAGGLQSPGRDCRQGLGQCRNREPSCGQRRGCVILSRRLRRLKRSLKSDLYEYRNRIESFFNRLKQIRRFTTR
jgi:hypothetical protein